MSGPKSKLVMSILEQRFSGFACVPKKMLWAKEADAGTLLLVGYQPSRTGLVFYLNFGVYYPAITPVEGLPKVTDWHLLARFERFETMNVDEYNHLFSLEDREGSSLEKRCAAIAERAEAKILPTLQLLGDFKKLKEQLAVKGSAAFEPYWAQNITKAQISAFILKDT